MHVVSYLQSVMSDFLDVVENVLDLCQQPARPLVERGPLYERMPNQTQLQTRNGFSDDEIESHRDKSADLEGQLRKDDNRANVLQLQIESRVQDHEVECWGGKIAAVEDQLQTTQSSARIPTLQTEAGFRDDNVERLNAKIGELEDLLQRAENRGNLYGADKTSLKTERDQLLRERAQERKSMKEIVELKDRLEKSNANSKLHISENNRLKTEMGELFGQWDQERQEMRKMMKKIVELEDHLQKSQNILKLCIAENNCLKTERDQRLREWDQERANLDKQIRSMEKQNSEQYSGGESFIDTGATPYLLTKAVHRVNEASRTFSKNLIVALKGGNIDCRSVARTLNHSVTFSREAHLKYAFQALVCRVMFSNFEKECFSKEDYGTKILDLEQYRAESFRQYTVLEKTENAEKLVLAGAPDSQFRRFCDFKQSEFIEAISGNIGKSDEVGGLIFGELGFKREDVSNLEKTFVRLAQSVWLLHRLAFAFQPTARIFRVENGVEFLPKYMESVVMEERDEGEDATAQREVGFTVVPGFYVNKIVFPCKVYVLLTSDNSEASSSKVADVEREPEVEPNVEPETVSMEED